MLYHHMAADGRMGEQRIGAGHRGGSALGDQLGGRSIAHLGGRSQQAIADLVSHKGLVYS